MKKLSTSITTGGGNRVTGCRLELFCLLLIGISCCSTASAEDSVVSSPLSSSSSPSSNGQKNNNLGGIYPIYGSGRSSTDYGGGWDRPEFNYDDFIKVSKNWVARQSDDDEEKNPGDGGLYGLFGLFGLMGALPFALPLLLILFAPLILLLLFIPIPIIGGRRSYDMSHINPLLFNSSFTGNSNMMDTDGGPLWASAARGIGSDMQNILMSIAKDWKTARGSYSGCLERLSCSMARMAKNIRPPQYAMDRLTGLMGGSNNKFFRRIQRGITTAGKRCSRFKCDLLT